MNRITIFLVCMILNTIVCAQDFQRVSGIDIRGGYLGFSSWCDYNSDGLLDIFVTGLDFGGDFKNAEIYINNGNNTFSESGITNIPRVIYGNLDWGDFDNNGTLDLIYGGTQSGFSADNITKIYKNIGNTSLVEITHNIPALGQCYFEWVDINNDGLLDIYYQGINSSMEFDLGIYKNEGSDNFIQVDINIEKVTGPRGNFNQNSAKWADFDNDGLKDVIIGMSSRDNFELQFYKNLGDFKFQKIDFGLPHLNYVKIAVGDINQDGQMDIIFTGSTLISLGSADMTADLHIFINNGEMSFEEVTKINNVGVFLNNLELGDIDGDGYLDILNYGTGSRSRELRIYKNNGDNTFSTLSHSIIEASEGGASFGDFDNDNDLDILYYGRIYTPSKMEVTYVYENNSSTVNNIPYAPDNISLTAYNNDLMISWTNGSDDSTLSESLYYNLSIGTISNPDTLLSSNSLNGKLKTVDIGNMNLNKSFSYTDFPEGNYNVKLQTIDNSYNASYFSDALNFCFKHTSALFGDTLAICNGDSITIGVDGGDLSYKWNTGSTDSIIYVNSEGMYNLNITHQDGCMSSETVIVKLNEKPELDLGEDIIMTDIDSIILTTSLKDVFYLWSDSTQNDSLIIYAENLDAGDHLFWLKVTNDFNCFDIDTVTVNVLKVLGISDFKNGLDVKIYPVPFQNEIMIESNSIITGITDIKLKDMNSKTIYHSRLDQFDCFNNLSLPYMKDGVYFLYVTNQSSNLRFIVKLLKQD